MSKPLKLEHLTELREEWTLHDGGFKKFVLVINFVYGVPYLKYGVYRGDLCIKLSENRHQAFERYVALEEQELLASSNMREEPMDDKIVIPNEHDTPVVIVEELVVQEEAAE